MFNLHSKRMAGTMNPLFWPSKIIHDNFSCKKSAVCLHHRDGDKLYGRGSTDDKGPVLGWLHVIQVNSLKRTVGNRLYPISQKSWYPLVTPPESCHYMYKGWGCFYFSDISKHILPPSILKKSLIVIKVKISKILILMKLKIYYANGTC